MRIGKKTTNGKIGHWSMAYLLEGQFDRPSLKKLRTIVEEIRLPYTGWALFYLPAGTSSLKVRPRGDTIECFLDDGWDFWRVSTMGRAFLIRPYQEDFLDANAVQGEEFDVTLPIWRVGEGLLHSQRLAFAFNAENATVAFKVIWDDLHGRKLIARGTPELMLSFTGSTFVATENRVASFLTVSAQNISATLPELVQRLTEPLYNNFDFFSPPATLYINELGKMRQSNVGALG